MPDPHDGERPVLRREGHRSTLETVQDAIAYLIQHIRRRRNRYIINIWRRVCVIISFLSRKETGGGAWLEGDSQGVTPFSIASVLVLRTWLGDN